MRITSPCRGSSSRMTYSADMKSRIRRLYCFMALVGTLSLPFADAAEDRSWVERSDRISAIVFESLGPFQPEHASALGLERFDTAALDLKPGRTDRYEAAARRVLQRLAALRKAEKDPRVGQDLALLIDTVERQRRTRVLEHRLLIPYFDVPKHVFEGLQMLLDARNGEPRHRNALQRMRVYAGLERGVAPFAELAHARASERFAIAGLLWPYEAEVRQHLENCERYIGGIAELFRASEVRDWQSAHERLAAQLRAHCEWVRDVVLPRARKDHTLPRELYADRLKSFGVDITPERAISLGMLAFAEVREEISRLAAQIARERKLDSGDYRQVLRELKRQQVPPERRSPSTAPMSRAGDSTPRASCFRTFHPTGSSSRCSSACCARRELFSTRWSIWAR